MAIIKIVGISDNGASTTNPWLNPGDVAMDTETGRLKRTTGGSLWLDLPDNDASRRVGTVVSSATPAINTDNVDQFNITLLATNITSLTSGLTGSPDDGDELTLRITSDATPRTIAHGAKFTGTLLTTTAASKTHTEVLRYDGAAAKWVGIFADATGY
jgi:hypothetical protein